MRPSACARPSTPGARWGARSTRRAATSPSAACWGEGSPEGVAALQRAGDAFERLGVAHLAGQARGLARA